MTPPKSHDGKEQPLSPLERANALLAQARAAAREQVRELEVALEATVVLSGEIAEGGEVYPPGVREICRRMTDDAAAHGRTLNTLAMRLLEAQAPR